MNNETTSTTTTTNAAPATIGPRVNVLRPGLLVSLKTSIRGGVAYFRKDLEPDRITEEGERIARWETKREIYDAQEYERATVARSKARAIITGKCAHSDFGLMCPEAQEEELREAIRAARTVANEHNRDATRTQVEVYVMLGRVAVNDVEAVRAISAEMRGLMDDIKAGIADANPEAIREAANKARNMNQVLTESTQAKVKAAIDEARAIAKEIKKRIEKSGTDAAAVVKELGTKKLDEARFAFLDLDEQTQGEQIAAPARAVDIDPCDDNDATTTQASAAPAPAAELADNDADAEEIKDAPRAAPRDLELF
jgi:hypothetical protein